MYVTPGFSYPRGSRDRCDAPAESVVGARYGVVEVVAGGAWMVDDALAERLPFAIALDLGTRVDGHAAVLVEDHGGLIADIGTPGQERSRQDQRKLSSREEGPHQGRMNDLGPRSSACPFSTPP